MNYDKRLHAQNAAADFISILSDLDSPTALELFEAMHIAIDDEIEWHQSSIDKIRLFKELVSG